MLLALLLSLFSFYPAADWQSFILSVLCQLCPTSLTGLKEHLCLTGHLQPNSEDLEHLPALKMWFISVFASLLPAVFMISKRYRVKVLTLCRRARAWTLWFVRGTVCTQSIHAFVFCKSTHGRVDSVLDTYDLYNRMYPSLSISPQIGAALDEVLRRVQPSVVLELGMHCGYSSLRMLRLLPPGGKLITVEVDPTIADYGEELILVAGYKHHQFQVLISSSEEAIPSLSGYLGSHQEGFGLVLMDHDPLLYLTDLRTLETEGLLCPSGCSIILIHRDRADRDLLEHIQTQQHYCIKTDSEFFVEVCYQNPVTETR